ncbi:DNA-3-methyladenine glycosylase I [Patescibacteria group bacterium]|nr:DNA-3-methyladenine glycosylase I [Patescibacteria group bacterium]
MKKRCGWSQGDTLMERYHDTEWGVPLHNDRKLFEFLLLDSFQAGLSWSTILNKREHFRKAFDNFNPKRVAKYRRVDIKRLLTDEGIVRNRLKVNAAVSNARLFLEIQKEYGSFDSYVWKFVGGKPKVGNWKSFEQIPATSSESDALSIDLKKRRFSFVGSTIIYAFMQASGLANDHVASCFRYKKLRRLSQ